MNKTLHWTQRVALVRHNLHAASRSLDFGFFKSLQAQGLLDGTNHVATLSATLGDEADAVLAGLDDLNASIAQTYEDAFRNVYNSLKTYLGESEPLDSFDSKARIFVDGLMQKQMADHSIDKNTSSAIALIQQQPPCVQETAANVWITGNTMISDSIEICLQHMDGLEQNSHDFIRLEESWNTVKASVGHSVSALKAIFTLMSPDDPEPQSPATPSSSFSGGMFRRLSNAFTTNAAAHAANSLPASPSPSLSAGMSRSTSLGGEYRLPNYRRASVSSLGPGPIGMQGFRHTDLDAIPPTPSVMDTDVDPFNTSMPGLRGAPSLPDIRISQSVA